VGSHPSAAQSKNHKSVEKHWEKDKKLGIRGRKSMTELAIGPVVINRPEPPYNLTDAEADVWRQIVNAMPADHFAPSHFPLLVQLCRHVVSSDRVKLLIEQLCGRKQIDCDRLQSLLAMQTSESSSIVRLMRSLRLTPQSISRAESAKLRPLATGALAPWHSNPWDRKYDVDEKD
jgi:hypothetical protein